MSAWSADLWLRGLLGVYTILGLKYLSRWELVQCPFLQSSGYILLPLTSAAAVISFQPPFFLLWLFLKKQMSDKEHQLYY